MIQVNAGILTLMTNVIYLLSLYGDSGREKDPGQTAIHPAIHPGQQPPPSARHLHQAEECVQWPTAVPVQLH